MNSITKPPILLVGNFLSASQGTRGVGEDLSERLAARGWRVLTCSSRPGRAARLFDMLRTCWTRRRDYAVAHLEVYSGRAFFWADAVASLLRRIGKPYVLTLHGGNLPDFAWRWPRRVRLLLDGAAAVTAPSGYLLARMPKWREDVRLLPNAIEGSAYPFRLRERPRPALIWLRALLDVYDPATAVRVLARVRERHPDATLLLVGPEKQRGAADGLLALAGELGVAGAVTFAGPVPKKDVPRWLSSGDIFLNTTTVDNTPVSVLEAMACGLCVVSTDVGGLPYLLQSGTDSLMVPPRDHAAMAAAVERFLAEPELAARCSGNGRAKAMSADWSASLGQWEALFLQAAPEHTR